MNYTEHFDSFWQRYGADEGMSVTSKGSKFKAFESWEKISKQWSSREHKEHDEQEFAQHVWRGYEAQKSNRRALKASKQFVPTLPMVTTYLNQWRFETELDRSTGDIKRESQTVRRCSHGDCGEPVLGRSLTGGWVCRNHDLNEWAERNREGFRARLIQQPREPGESWKDWSWRYLLGMPTGRELLAKMKARNPDLKAPLDNKEEELRAAHRAKLEQRLREIREEVQNQREAEVQA